MKFFPLIWRNLMRKKIRTFMTFMSILVAFVLFGFLAAITKAFNVGIEMAGEDRIIVRHKVSLIQLLPESYKARMEKINGVELAAHATWFGGEYQEAKNSFFGQFPVDPDDYFDIYPEFDMPEEQMKKWKETRTGAVVGRATADALDFKIGQRVPIKATIWDKEGGERLWEFDIVGIYDAKEGKKADTTLFLFRYDYFEEARATEKGTVGWYTVRISDPDRSAQIAQEIDDLFANSSYETKAEPEGAFVQGFIKQIGDIGAIMRAIMTAVFFTILLVAGNTMAQSVRERMQEIGVLKALGFTNGQALALTLGESCLLAALSGLSGLGIAWLAVTGIAESGELGNFLPIFFLPTRDVWIGGGLVAVLGICAGLAPALQARWIGIAAALRRE